MTEEAIHVGPTVQVGRAQRWYGYWLTPDDVATSLVGLRAAADRVEKPAGLGTLEISVTPRGRITPDRAAAYAVVGEDRLVVLPPPTPDGSAETIDAAAAAVADP